MDVLKEENRKDEWLDRWKEGSMEKRMDGQMITFKAIKTDAREPFLGWSDCASKRAG